MDTEGFANTTEGEQVIGSSIAHPFSGLERRFVPGTAAGVGYPTSQAIQRIAQDSLHQSSEGRAIVVNAGYVTNLRRRTCLSIYMSFANTHPGNPSRKGFRCLIDMK